MWKVAATVNIDPRAHDHAQPVLVALPAEVDMLNADRIAEQLAAACACGVRVVIADMSATTFCDSPAFGMLWAAKRNAAANGTDLRLLLPSPDLWQIMQVLGLDAVLPTYRSLDEALADPSAPAEPVSGPERVSSKTAGDPLNRSKTGLRS